METGERAARDGDEQDREHHAGGGGKAREHRGGDGGLALGAEHHDAEDGAHDHDDHHDGSQVVARLLESLDGHGTGEHQVHHDDCNPTIKIEVDGELHAKREHGDHEDDACGELLGAREVELATSPTEGHGDEGEQDRDRARATGGIGLGKIDRAGSVGRELEGAGDHGGERRDHNQAEQPAEQQEQATPRAADVLLDELGEGLAVVLHRGVQRAEIVHRAKEDATHEHPQHDRKPTERHGDDGARDGTRATDRAELVREDGEGGRRREVLAILHAARRREGITVDAPFTREPPSVTQVTCGQNCRGNHHQYDSVHGSSPS